MNKKLEQLRHSAAHLLAHAISELYPDTIFTIGPATEDGFFYDVLPCTNFKEADLTPIETRMKQIRDRNLPLTHELIDKKTAQKFFKDNRFKLELIEGIPGDMVGLARQGDFYDLCKGGHVSNTSDIQHFELLAISGSYWRADKNNQPLQRISGTAFLTQEDFDSYKQQKEDAIKYDHRRIGKQLDLFSFHPEGPGFPFYHPHGKTILNTLISHIKKFLGKYEYVEIATPVMLTNQLWQQSGHYDFYKDKMYFCTIDEIQYAVRPMNCPGSILIYKERPRSYRELPLRLAEFGLDHRYELSGVMNGLLRTRSFTQDDAHIYCTPESLEQEIENTIHLWHDVWQKFNFEKVFVRIATKPEKSMGPDILWEKATNALINPLKKIGFEFEILPGEGAFYGPKIEFHVLDSMGRSWQCGTIQVDFAQPENFDLKYVANDGSFQRPVIIHRAIYGSLERFFAILLEHFKGKLPFWLAPIQMSILTITDTQKEYAHFIKKILIEKGFRTIVDESSDPISGKIKNAIEHAIPWALIIGKKEMEQKTISIRYLDGKQELGLSLEQLIEKGHINN
jgi:threonyl-tRNA synthetase